MSVQEKMTAIADAIREKTGGAEKLSLDAMAAAIPEVYAAGEAATAADCAARHFTAHFAGNGENSFSLAIPFDPDMVCIVCHSAYTNVTTLAGAWLDLRFNRRNAARYAMHFMYIPAGGNRTNVRVAADTARQLLSYSDGMLTLSAPNDTLKQVFWRSDCMYILTAVKYTDKTDKELVSEEIALLPDTGGTVEYSLIRINEIFETVAGANDGAASVEWEALVATKPNWTITLA